MPIDIDPKYYLVLAAAVILAIIFIKQIWKLVIILAIITLAYWYFFLR